MTREEFLAQRELPVALTFKLAARQVLQNLPHLLRFGIPLYLVLLAGYLAGVTQFTEDGALEQHVPTLIWTLAYWLTMVLVAVNCHQLFIAGPEHAKNLSTFRLSRREWRFLWYGILLMLVIFAALIPIMIVFGAAMAMVGDNETAESVLVFLITLPLAYLVARLSLVFPAIAMGEPAGFPEARRWSRPVPYRLTLMLGLVPMLTSTASEVLPYQDTPWGFALANLIWLPVLAFELCLLSLCYSYLTRHTEQHREGEPEPEVNFSNQSGELSDSG